MGGRGRIHGSLRNVAVRKEVGVGQDLALVDTIEFFGYSVGEVFSSLNVYGPFIGEVTSQNEVDEATQYDCPESHCFV